MLGILVLLIMSATLASCDISALRDWQYWVITFCVGAAYYLGAIS